MFVVEAEEVFKEVRIVRRADDEVVHGRQVPVYVSEFAHAWEAILLSCAVDAFHVVYEVRPIMGTALELVLDDIGDVGDFDAAGLEVDGYDVLFVQPPVPGCDLVRGHGSRSLSSTMDAG